MFSNSIIKRVQIKNTIQFVSSIKGGFSEKQKYATIKPLLPIVQPKRRFFSSANSSDNLSPVTNPVEITNLEKKKILITGVSSGLGKALVKEFLNNGYIVYGISRSQPSFVENLHHPCFYFLSLDLTDPEISSKLKAFISQNSINKLDIIYLNAAIFKNIDFIKNKEVSDLTEIVNTNVWGNHEILSTFFNSGVQVTQVICSSSSSWNSPPFQGLNGYALSKAALTSLIKIYASEHEKTHFFLMTPGYFKGGFYRKVREAIENNPEMVNKFPVIEPYRMADNGVTFLEPSDVAHLIYTALPRIKKMPTGTFKRFSELFPTQQNYIFLVGQKFKKYADYTGNMTVSEFITKIKDPLILDNGFTKKTYYVTQGVTEGEVNLLKKELQDRKLASINVLISNDLLIPSQETHKKKSENILISSPEKLSDGKFRASLIVNPHCAELSDHNSGHHIDGMIVIEAARQAAIAISEKYHLLDHAGKNYSFIFKDLAVHFDHYLFPSEVELQVSMQPLEKNGNSASKGNIFEPEFVMVYFFQNGAQCAKATLNFKVISSPKLEEIEREKASNHYKDFGEDIRVNPRNNYFSIFSKFERAPENVHHEASVHNENKPK